MLPSRLNRRSCSVADKRIIAVGLLTRRDVTALGPTFTRLWPVDETPCFSQLLLAIDDADRELRRESNGDALAGTLGRDDMKR